ncbi:helix-turn-helix domain-containing protein [Pedobacter sp.]|uniref:helix-turn-helix domain-containing protein n=1 Tax=Pedobacter sp. TaxID=1411316 RepID=UPI002BA89D56|nr:helix-turn-helix domain-containing protein [Pedobacter sp.]HWW41602.1 helix-turn-helix domain-containing protein [Pedobacter sp.]
MMNKSLVTYYTGTGNPDSALKCQKSYSSLLDQRAHVVKTVSNQLFKEMEGRQHDHYSIGKILAIILRILLGLVILLIYLCRQIIKKSRSEYEQTMLKLKYSQNLLLVENSLVLNKDQIFKSELRSVMAKESEGRLLEKLNKLEVKNFFLQRDVSLSSVSTKLSSNTKYISYIINKYKGKDFNNYVNELRINYAVSDLHLNPEVRRYKISYLANKYGFSSHSKFAAIFKSIIGVSPSVFIGNLKIDHHRKSVEGPVDDLIAC